MKNEVFEKISHTEKLIKIGNLLKESVKKFL